MPTDPQPRTVCRDCMRGAVDQWGAVAAWGSNQPCHPSRVLQRGDQWGELGLLPSWWWWGEGWRTGSKKSVGSGSATLPTVPLNQCYLQCPEKSLGLFKEGGCCRLSRGASAKRACYRVSKKGLKGQCHQIFYLFYHVNPAFLHNGMFFLYIPLRATPFPFKTVWLRNCLALKWL